MQYKDIEIFLELVNSRNITKASEHLFMAQSVISTRLKNLEEELGYDLFIRSKGMREIELTRQGYEFIRLATRMQALYDEAALLKESYRQTLRIAAPESIYYDLLEPVIFNVIRRNPEVHITADMEDSSGVYQQMESGKIDYGFASYESSHKNIIHHHMYDQEFRLVRANPSAEPVSPSQLDPTKEIIFTGGNFSPIDLWRDSHFPGSDQSRIHVNSSIMIARYLQEFDAWALLPKELAEMLSELYGVSVSELTDAPESRKIYFLMHANSAVPASSAATLFFEELRSYERY